MAPGSQALGLRANAITDVRTRYEASLERPCRFIRPRPVEGKQNTAFQNSLRKQAEGKVKYGESISPAKKVNDCSIYIADRLSPKTRQMRLILKHHIREVGNCVAPMKDRAMLNLMAWHFKNIGTSQSTSDCSCSTIQKQPSR